MDFDVKIAIACIIFLIIFIIIYNNGINWSEFAELTVLLIFLLWLLGIKIPIEIPGIIKIGEELREVSSKLESISTNINNIKIDMKQIQIKEFYGTIVDKEDLKSNAADKAADKKI